MSPRFDLCPYCNTLGVCTSWRDAEDIERDARDGDKLDFKRGTYNHVGIADGKGGVFHFSGEPKRKTRAVYRHDPLEDVAGGDKVRINNTEDRRLKPLPRKQIVKRARESVGTGKGEYHLLRNNCEHSAHEYTHKVDQRPAAALCPDSKRGEDQLPALRSEFWLHKSHRSHYSKCRFAP